MTKKIIAQKVTTKPGVSASGKNYIKYGICDQDNNWYNSFQSINATEGNEYEIEYEVSKFGNDLKSIKPVGEESHKVNGENRQNSIIRQHSQEMAIRWLTMNKVDSYIDDLDKDLKPIIDWFEKDASSGEIPF